MTEETERASGATICTRLKYADEVSDFYSGQFCATCQYVERCAKRTGQIVSLFGGIVEFVENRDRIVALDGLSQVAGSSQVVMHAAVKYQELLASRNLDVIDTTNIHTSFPYQIAARFDHELSAGKKRIVANSLEESVESCLELLRVEGFFVRKIRGTKAPTEVKRMQRFLPSGGNATRRFRAPCDTE